MAIVDVTAIAGDRVFQEGAGLLEFAERGEVTGEVVGGREGVEVAGAKDLAAAGKGVGVQVAGSSVFAESSEIQGEAGGRVERVGVVFAQDSL